MLSNNNIPRLSQNCNKIWISQTNNIKTSKISREQIYQTQKIKIIFKMVMNSIQPMNYNNI